MCKVSAICFIVVNIKAPLFCSNRNTIILEFGHRGKMAITLLAYCSEAFTLLAYGIMAM